MHFDTPLGELGGDQIGGALFFETEFGMRVDVAAQRLDLGLRGLDFWDQLHEGARVLAENSESRSMIRRRAISDPPSADCSCCPCSFVWIRHAVACALSYTGEAERPKRLHWKLVN